MARETVLLEYRTSDVPWIVRIVSMIVILIVTALIALAVVTQAGVIAVQRRFPPQGQMVEVDGATLHVVELGERDSSPPIVMLHGASSNLEVMRRPLGDLLAERHRVILIDRPGHGWSTRARRQDSTPEVQARMIDEALEGLAVDRAVFVVHSWSGALGARLALDHPRRVAALVMLAPVTHPWCGGVGRYNEIIATPVIGPLLAYTITLPLGWLVTAQGARNVFLPQMMPDGFVRDSATPLLLRPREFIANAFDLVTLKQSVVAQMPRYGEITAPTVIIAGEADKTVSTAIHSRPFAAMVPNARLIVLPDLGHMVQNSVPDLVKGEIEALLGTIAPAKAAANELPPRPGTISS